MKQYVSVLKAPDNSEFNRSHQNYGSSV